MEAVPIPAGTLVSKVFPRLDHADACRMPAAGSAPDLARRMLTVRSRVGGGPAADSRPAGGPFGIRPAHGRLLAAASRGR
jgi:hypothetical protein